MAHLDRIDFGRGPSFDGEAIRGLTAELCAIPARVTGGMCAQLFERLGRELPLEIHRFASGSTYNGWVVPDDWRVEHASIERDGRLVFDGTRHPLAVASNSRSFRGELDLDALRPRLVSYPHLPEAHPFHSAWQYRPWDAGWAFCVPHRIVAALEPGRYAIDLRTTSGPGTMYVGEHIHVGRSDRTIVFNAHTCHPGQANDDMAGVATLVHVARGLQGRDTHFTYRFVFGPEHLGTVFYLAALDPARVDAMIGGVFAEMPGTAGPMKLASSFLGGQVIDRAVAAALRESGEPVVHVGWREGAGNDETVWEAPGYEVPFVELSRCLAQFAPFPEYHSSLDTAALMRPERLRAFAEVLWRSIEILETNAVMHRRFDGLVCLSNPAHDLYFERPDPAIDKSLGDDAERWGHLLDSLLRTFDGRTTILDIARAHDLPYRPLLDYVRRFEAKGLVTLERAPAARPAARRVDGSAPVGANGTAAEAAGCASGRAVSSSVPSR